MLILGHRSLGLQFLTLANRYLAHAILSSTSRFNFPKQNYQWEGRPQHSQFHMFQLKCQNPPNFPMPVANPSFEVQQVHIQVILLSTSLPMVQFLIGEKHWHYSISWKFQVFCKRLFIVACLPSIWIEAAHGSLNAFAAYVVSKFPRFMTSFVNTIHNFLICF